MNQSSIMVDLEVEKTLREIRERVRAEAAAGGEEPAQAPTRGAELSTLDAATGAAGVSSALGRLEVNVSTAERARSRLPPLVSNRKGWPARLELWVKRQIKRATHWFTWEQVNYNAAVYHALRDTHAALAALDSELASLRRQLHTFEEQLDARDARLSEELAAGVASLRGEQRAFVDDIHREQRALASDLRREQGALTDGLRGDINGGRVEARERAAHVLEEQRVLFRQLSLEASERAVACERSRRDLETRLAEIKKDVMSDK
ncbi:MAG TPA: hypothetical protein VF240_03365 [Pyrinomonadaceae bacterium]